MPGVQLKAIQCARQTTSAGMVRKDCKTRARLNATYPVHSLRARLEFNPSLVQKIRYIEMEAARPTTIFIGMPIFRKSANR